MSSALLTQLPTHVLLYAAPAFLPGVWKPPDKTNQRDQSGLTQNPQRTPVRTPSIAVCV